MSLFEKLTRYADKERISFAMPGHKGGRGLSEEFKRDIARLDVTELSDTENLYLPKCEIKNAKKALAKRFCAKESFFLTGGSTEGVQIMLFSVARGGKILTNRNCHRSVINAAVIGGFDLCCLRQEEDKALMTPLPPTADEVEEKLAENPDITACIITSPDYYGHIADIKGISEACHRHGIPLLVDEAHGASLYADGMSGGALGLGADMAVESAHKTLNALNQSAYLHWNSDIIDIEKVRQMTAMVATSSPSYPIVASAELALSGLAGTAWRELTDYLENKRQALLKNTEIKYPSGMVDASRLVFGFSNYDITGYAAGEILKNEYNIDVEMTDRFNAVCIATPTNTREETDILFSAIESILQRTPLRKREAFPEPPVTETVLSPQKAFFAKKERVALGESIGRVSGTTVTAYPPGTAIVAIGERISAETVSYIDKITGLGAQVEGLSDGDFILVAE